MRRIRIFCNEITGSGFTVLDRSNAHYVSDVLRCGPGDIIEILTGDGRVYSGRICVENRKYIVKELIPVETNSSEMPIINLFTGVIKGSGFDYAIEKASEIGAASVTPVYCEYSRAGRISSGKLERYVRIARSSALQCKRLYPLSINEPVSLADIFGNIPYGNNFFLDVREENRVIGEEADFSRPFNIFSGPEGGFSDKELEKFRHYGFKGFSLGPNILRAETIPLVICSIILYEYFRRNG